MKLALPENAKIAKEAKECMQECVSEFISFITSEGEYFRMLCRRSLLTSKLASEKCQQEKRKTVNGEDILFAMTSLGFENYAEALKIYLSKFREVGCFVYMSGGYTNCVLDSICTRRKSGPPIKQRLWWPWWPRPGSPNRIPRN